MALSSESSADISRFFASIKSLNELDRLEVRNLVSTGLIGAPTNREHYFLLNYNRAVLSVDLLLTLTGYKHFQTVANISRSVFEIAVEMWMMQAESGSTEKITAFIECEKLRAARKIMKYGVNDTKKAGLLSIYMDYIKQNGDRIDAEQQRIWPGKRKVGHWSVKDMAQRCELLGGEFDELYSFHYAELSWYVHSGVIGVANVDQDTIAHLCGIAFQIIVKCYSLILEAIINCFQMYNADDRLKKKIVLARMLPFTESERERAALARVSLA
ncbi:MAG TPA: DUF5677 domain-containing protein [Bryobacteraceae bacterium]|nr:DUF5677 domain-containing protein [Bryobacteraceae bacterium]